MMRNPKALLPVIAATIAVILFIILPMAAVLNGWTPIQRCEAAGLFGVDAEQCASDLIDGWGRGRDGEDG